jgi:hypothetical protein
MKNIHILPTDKKIKNVGDLVKDQYGDIHIFTKNDGKEYGKTTTKLNIYITNDEEIKEGDWILDLDLKKTIKADSLKVITSKKSKCWYYKKIILTTDELYIHNDLIPKEYNPFPQYIQKIDIEFLEWFVKNPSCEEVEITHNIIDIKGGLEFRPILGYEIIIPKEEPKQKCQHCKQTISKYGCACGKQKEEPINHPNILSNSLTNKVNKQETLNLKQNTHYVDFSNPNADKISSASTTTINQETPLQFVASCIWNTSEYLHIPLGRFAPIVFGWMIGAKHKKLKNK